MDLRTIIDCLNHIMENEKEKLSHVQNPNGILGRMSFESHSLNISHATECKNCLQFLVETLPHYQPDFKEMKIFGHSPRKFKSIYDLQKYRTELKKVKDAVELYIWEAKISPYSKPEDLELGIECKNKLTQANSALYKIK